PCAADALHLPGRDEAFAGATVAFGLRNVADLDRALAELARVVRPGGRLAVLEFALPRRQPLRGLYLFYFRRLLPAIGRWVSRHGSAYTYLPASVTDFPQREGFLARLRAAGFAEAASHDLTGGILCLYLATRSSPP
ncbi:MAG: class I SAM-dependent methyltransferase, partial [Acidobacteriota bacterium]|nr:class I SAM-dependent methyltransferase [Acidobacteriota bacterium]